MPNIWLSSDYHFNHDREFIWKARGFNSVEEMNEEILRRHNSLVAPNDTIYILGDLMLGSKDKESMELVSYMNGNKIVVTGNHDSPKRRLAYEEDIGKVYDATTLKYRGYHFYLSHYPTITSNLEKESLKQCIINLHGHTHSSSKFYYDLPYCYHCGVDAHNCYPVSIDDIIEEIKQKIKECKEYL